MPLIEVHQRFEGVNQVTRGMWNSLFKRFDPIGILTFGLILGEIWVNDYADPSTSWTERLSDPSTTWTERYSDPSTVWTERFNPY